MKALTINDLMNECKKQIKLGNGNKTIMISQDDEGNGYHYLWYSFTTMEQMEEPITMPSGKTFEYEFEFVDERIAKKEDTIILG